MKISRDLLTCHFPVDFPSVPFGMHNVTQIFRKSIDFASQNSGVFHVYDIDLFIALPEVDEHIPKLTALFQLA